MNNVPLETRLDLNSSRHNEVIYYLHSHSSRSLTPHWRFFICQIFHQQPARTAKQQQIEKLSTSDMMMMWKRLSIRIINGQSYSKAFIIRSNHEEASFPHFSLQLPIFPPLCTYSFFFVKWMKGTRTNAEY